MPELHEKMPVYSKPRRQQSEKSPHHHPTANQRRRRLHVKSLRQLAPHKRLSRSRKSARRTRQLVLLLKSARQQHHTQVDPISRSEPQHCEQTRNRCKNRTCDKPLPPVCLTNPFSLTTLLALHHSSATIDLLALPVKMAPTIPTRQADSRPTDTNKRNT